MLVGLLRFWLLMGLVWIRYLLLRIKVIRGSVWLPQQAYNDNDKDKDKDKEISFLIAQVKGKRVVLNELSLYKFSGEDRKINRFFNYNG